MTDRGGMFVPLDSAGNGMSALDGRLALGGLIGTTSRCVSGGAISASATNMVFTIARAVFQLSDLDNAGAVSLSALDQQPLAAIPVGPTSGSRIDSIIVRQRIVGGSLSETSPYAVYATVQGTATTGTAAPPTIPTGWYEYARIAVPTNASTASACTTQVLYPAQLSPLNLQAGSAAALSLIAGTMIGQRATAAGIDYRWNGSTWRAWDSDWVPFTGIGYDSGSGGNAGTGATLSGQYRYRGGRVIAELFFAYGTSGATPGSYWKFALPILADATNWNTQATSCHVVFMNASEGFRRYVGGAYVETAGLLHLFAMGSNGASLEVTGSAPFGEAWSNQDQIRVTVEYDYA